MTNLHPSRTSSQCWCALGIGVFLLGIVIGQDDSGVERVCDGFPLAERITFAEESVATSVGRFVTIVSLLLTLQQFFRRASAPVAWIAWAFYFALPGILTPYWLISREHTSDGVFPWVKLYSVCFAACWLTGLRTSSFGRRRWGLAGMVVLLYVNILEAIVQDCVVGQFAHSCNAASGLLLLGALSARLCRPTLDSCGYHCDYHFSGTSRSWIVGYVLWDSMFIYLNFPAVAGHQLAVQAAAFAVGMVKPARWGQVRVYTLAADLLLIFVTPSLAIGWLNTAHWSNPAGRNVGAVVSFAYMLLLTSWPAMTKLVQSARPHEHETSPRSGMSHV